MPKFDDLSEEQQAKILEIADREIARDTFVNEYKAHRKEQKETTLKDFISRKGELSENVVPTSTLDVDMDTVTQVENTSGKYIERASLTFENNYQMTIARAPDTYGCDKGIFKVTSLDPSGKEMLSANDQRITDINTRAKAVSNMEYNPETESDDADEENKSSI